MTTDEFGVVGFSFVVRVDLAGYVGDLTLTSESCADLVRMVKTLHSAGIEQPVPVVTAPATIAPVASGEDAPLCKYHGKMKPSRFGGWHCTAKMGNGEYCEEKVK